MGATNFQTYGIGKTVGEAYQKAVEEALYWSGHGGYTGTIAEKSGYALITLPPRVSTQRFLHWIELLSYSTDESWTRERLQHLDSKRAPAGRGEAWRKEKAQLRKLLKEAEKARKSVPAQHRALVQQAVQVYDDKWGPALAFEVPATEARKIKEQEGLKGTRKRVFCFCGYASC